MTAAAAARRLAAVLPAAVAADAFVLPAAVTAGHPGPGPRFGEDVWDVRGFVPRTTRQTRVDFTTITDPGHARTVKEYLYSRINRGIPANQLSGTARPMKITGLATQMWQIRTILTDLAAAGAAGLSQVRREHLDTALAGWKHCPDVAAELVGVVKHIAAHGQFLTDRLSISPWPGRSANQVAGRRPPRENSTPRIPEPVMAPLLQAAVFYVQTASTDLTAARAEVAALQEACRAATGLGKGQARTRLETFIAARRAAGRGIPALPRQSAHHHRSAPVAGGVVQAPNWALTGLLANVPGGIWYHHDLITAAGAALGYEHGGLDTVITDWPGTGRPWRPRLDPWSLKAELSQLRTACWIVIAYLSGMRDAEVRELSRGCAFTEPGADGRTRYKLRGRVFKDRRLDGDKAEWVVLDVVHHAVGVLLAINDGPTHLFSYTGVRRDGMLANMPTRLNRFAAHASDLFSTAENPFIPDHGTGQHTGPWVLNPRQLRRTLAWHIAHQPFGVVAGARQYQHAQIAVFEGYAGTSTSGFAAEVEAEQALAGLDYVQDLYHDWLAGGPSGGGANTKVNAEFQRIHTELADLPGTVADPARLRTMLEHLATTLHPGVLGDCFYRPETALCAKRAKQSGKPLPMLDTCLSCPNARRSTVHLPRLQTARAQARTLAGDTGQPMPPLQRAAITGHLHQLDQLIGQITGSDQDAAPA